MQSVVRSLQILEAVAQHQPIRVGELVPIVKLPKSTVQRSLGTLAEAGWIEPIDGDLTRWAMSPRALSILQRTSLADVNLRDSAHIPMQELCTATGETVHLIVSNGAAHCVVLDRAESPRSIRTVIPLGSILLAASSACGLAMLAAGPDSLIMDAVDVARHSIGESMDIPTAEQLDAVPEIIAATRANGYSRKLGWDGDVVAIGAVIRDHGGRVVGGLSISILISRFDRRPESEWAAEVVMCASRISATLGYQPGSSG